MYLLYIFPQIVYEDCQTLCIWASFQPIQPLEMLESETVPQRKAVPRTCSVAAVDNRLYTGADTFWSPPDPLPHSPHLVLGTGDLLLAARHCQTLAAQECLCLLCQSWAGTHLKLALSWLYPTQHSVTEDSSHRESLGAAAARPR